MKRVFLAGVQAGFLSTLSAIAGVVLFLSSPSTLYAGFVTNGDFEGAYTNGKANGWSSWQGGWSNTITFAEEGTNQFAGGKCQRWGRADQYRVHGGLCQQSSTVAGATYEVIAWLRADSPDTGAWLEAGVDLTGQITNGEAASVSYTKLEGQGLYKWIRFRKIVKATGSTISFFTKLGHYNEPAGAHWAYVDNVSIQPRIVLEAEDYVNAYDTTTGNTGGAYRTGNVDIAPMPSGVGYNVGWVANTEWLEWTGVRSIGSSHVFSINYAAVADSSVQINVDGVNVTGAVTLPNSGGWNAYRRCVVPGVYWLSAASHTVRIVFNNVQCNLDSIEMVPLTAGYMLQAEDYANAYDTTAGNTGGAYRSGNVDIANSATEGYHVGWIDPGEWLEFPVQGDSRCYSMVIRYAGIANGSVNMVLNGNNVTGSVALASSGGWDTWRTIVAPQVFTLATGANTVRLNMETSGFNVSFINLVPLGDGAGGNELLTGIHFAGNPAEAYGSNQIASMRGAGNWIYSVEFNYNNNRDLDYDQAYINEMTDWIVRYLKPMYQAKIKPLVRLDFRGENTLPPFLPDGSLDNGAIDRYVRSFRKFAQIANANGVPVRTYILANENNLRCEAQNFTNNLIPEWYYAYVYDLLVRTMNRDLGPGYEVLIAGLSPGSLSADPLQTPPDPNWFWANYSADALPYLENILVELKRKGTPNVGLAVHEYNDFDGRYDNTISFYWNLRKQLEILEKSHTVIPYGQTQPVTIGGFCNAPVYITEWNKHTPVDPPETRAVREAGTSNFIRRIMLHITKWNRDRMVFDNVANCYRTYDARGIQANFHPIKGVAYFVFDTLGGPWFDYSIKEWGRLPNSATGTDDMFNTYQAEIGMRDPAGR